MSNFKLSPPRLDLFDRVQAELHHKIEVYFLTDRFPNLPDEYKGILALDVSKVPGCHYGVNNVFVPIIKQLEELGIKIGGLPIQVNPNNAILIEPSTGNGWVAFSNAANSLGYEHIVVMPDGLPEARYKGPEKTKIIRTSKEKYAAGMPEKIWELISSNKSRLTAGQKIYVSPNHPIGNSADITVQAMGDMVTQLLAMYSGQIDRLFISMGNGASLCGVGEPLKKIFHNLEVCVTETFAYGGGWNRFIEGTAQLTYQELYGIPSGSLMKFFQVYGTNAPIGIELPLQERGLKITDQLILCSDEKVLDGFFLTNPSAVHRVNAENLPRWDILPKKLRDTYGNSSLMNIAAAIKAHEPGKTSLVMIYDGRQNYS